MVPHGGAGKEEEEHETETLSSPEGYPLSWGKILKVGASSSPLSAVRAEDSLGRAAEPPLEVLLILAWSPTSRGAAPPPAIPDEVTSNRDRFEVAGDKESLLSHTELATGAVSFILRDSDLIKVDTLPVEEALALPLQEPPLYVQVLSSIFFFIVSVLLTDFLLVFFFFLAGGYLYERLGKEGQPYRGLRQGGEVLQG